MALNLVINTLSQTLPKGQATSSAIWKQLCKSKFRCNYISVANITSVQNRDPDYKRPKPFPYKTKEFWLYNRMFERTSDRFDENTKIIVVDGPIAVGKSCFAKKLAQDLDMLFIPEGNMDYHYINSYGYDFRELDPQLPPNARSVDEKKFCYDPDKITSAALQHLLYSVRYAQYIDALAHLFSTGQGVVMVRSVYSDMVFMDAVYNEGYVRKPVRDGYYFVRKETIGELLRPHLVIYLDSPVPVVQQKIKERDYDYEVNGKALTKSFLANIEKAYKQRCLPELEKHAELLVYDWSEGGDAELVVEDIERLDFDKYTYYDSKMRDWMFPKEQDIHQRRLEYADYKDELMTMLNIPLVDCPELYMNGDESLKYEALRNKSPGNKYTKGYNMDMGDSVFWKMGHVRKNSYPNC